MINSLCNESMAKAFEINGGASAITLNNGGQVRIRGGYDLGASGATWSGALPLTGQSQVKDPFLGLPVPTVTAPVTTDFSINGVTQSRVLSPGVYRGGIKLGSSARAFLRPGVYVIDGGGITLGAQSQFCSVSTAVANVIEATGTAMAIDCKAPGIWSPLCPNPTCGVMIYNTGTEAGSVSAKLSSISVGAGTTLKLRAYDERALAGFPNPEYRNLLIWQSGTPLPTATYQQPVLSLTGGGSVDIGGTIYAPSAPVFMTGGPGGGAGSADTAATLQFISWDLEIQGNTTFKFFYSDDELAQPTEYGLVQ
jgi:hypothetical protein